MAVQILEPRRPVRQDTFDLRNDIITDDASHRSQQDGTPHSSDGEHSVLDDDSSNEDGEEGEYIDDDDGSSSLSIPNESIDFDLVYSLHTFAATVEGQASVVKGDSLFLMDDSNSYWWLVRVLTTQDVGYIPAENIETPFERLARLNKHRNVDLASATQEELQEDVQTSRDRMRGVLGPRNGQAIGPSDPAPRKSVVFTGASVYNYPPALWGDEEEDMDWDEEDLDEEGEYEDDEEQQQDSSAGHDIMEPDDGMSWDDSAVEVERARGTATASTFSVSPVASIAPISPLSPGTASASTQMAAGSTAPGPAGGLAPLSPTATSIQHPLGLASTLRQQNSRERLEVPDSPAQASPSSPQPPSPLASVPPAARVLVDPAAAGGETRVITATPSIAREAVRLSLLQQETINRRQEILAPEDENARRKRLKEAQPVSSISLSKVNSSNEGGKTLSPSGGKLRKGRDSPAPEEDTGKEKKKKGGMFGGLFSRKKDKAKEKAAEGNEGLRNSEDSSYSANTHGVYTVTPPETSGPSISSPTSSVSMRTRDLRTSTEQRRINAGSTPPPGQNTSASPQQPSPPNVSQHSLKMQQIDQQQQALYQQYLRSSPASHPEGPSYGLQSAASVAPSGSNNGLTPGFRTQGGRPGSLILSPTNFDGPGVPELSVIRVFAGPSLHTEATFKTVLLNASTTSSDLIRQAMQRFRLAAGEDAADYYLEIKQVEGSSAILLPHERPLGVFESLVEAAQLEVPRVKRSSMGSISSISSTLSMHPAIKKLSMNDFTDDSAVKFYLNRRTTTGADANADGEDDDTIRLSASPDADIASLASPVKPSLTLVTTGGSNVTPERFSSPSARFALQVVILPEDVPDGMVFDPHTEAIVPKSTLRDRSLVNAAASPGVSMAQRKKVLLFPKNTTVAEVIELALERFGIAEGVVDGGDEIEDKLARRISLARVRYGLAVQVDGQAERQLLPSSKILDAYIRQPVFKPADRRSGEKRRSVDSAMLLGMGDEIRPDDPVFFLRRAVGFRPTGKSRMSAPLDEIALQHLHQRESAPHSGGTDDSKSFQQEQQMSRQELIAAQRAQSRANQRAILSAHSNSERGVDVILQGNAMLRSSVHETSDKIRYSYVQDGEIYDISDIVEEERLAAAAAADGNKRDWLEGVVASSQDAGSNLDRLLSRIKGNKAPNAKGADGVPLLSPGLTEISQRSSVSSYSVGEQEAAGHREAATSEATLKLPAPPFDRSKSGSRTEVHAGATQPEAGATVPSEDSSPEESSPSTPATNMTNSQGLSNSITNNNGSARKGPLVMKDDFGVSNMIAIIELRAAAGSVPRVPVPVLDPVDEMLFGPKVNMDELHPRVREMFEGTLNQLDDMDKQLDRALAALSSAV